MKKIIKVSVIILGLIFVLSIILGLFSSNGQKSFQKGLQDGRGTVEEQGAVGEMDALKQMEVAFIGNPSEQDIKTKLDQAFTLYKTERSEENYSRAGSVLVSLRKESKNNVTEMEILDYMIRSHAENVNMSFPDAAAIAFTALEKNIDGNR